MNRRLSGEQEAAIVGFCARNRVRDLSLFGSATGDDFGPDSDVDVRIDFAPGEAPSLFRFVDLQAGLGLLFGGRRVDLVCKGGLSKYVADRVLSQRVVSYER